MQGPFPAIDLWRKPGDDLGIQAPRRRQRPTFANTLSCTFELAPRSARLEGLIRDEETAGSRPGFTSVMHRLGGICLVGERELSARSCWWLVSTVEGRASEHVCLAGAG